MIFLRMMGHAVASVMCRGPFRLLGARHTRSWLGRCPAMAVRRALAVRKNEREPGLYVSPLMHIYMFPLPWLSERFVTAAQRGPTAQPRTAS